MRFAVHDTIVMMQLRKHSNSVIIVLYQLDKVYPDNTAVRMFAKNGKEIGVSGRLIDPKPVDNEHPVIDLKIISTIAISAKSHKNEDRDISLKRAFHMLIFFLHSEMVGNCEQMPVLHIKTDTVKRSYDSYSFDGIQVSSVDDAEELLNHPNDVSYTILPIAVRRADSIFPKMDMIKKNRRA